MVGRGEGLATEGGGGGRVDVSVCVRYLSFVSLSCPTNISAFQVFFPAPKPMDIPGWILEQPLNIRQFWKSDSKKYGEVTQKFMGKCHKIMGKWHQIMGKWCQIMGKWVKIYGEMTQNYGEVKQNTMGNRLNGKVSTPQIFFFLEKVFLLNSLLSPHLG